MPYLGSGPQWNLVVTQHANICKQTWWRNFLFIHNYFGFENMVRVQNKLRKPMFFNRDDC